MKDPRCRRCGWWRSTTRRTGRALSNYNDMSDLNRGPCRACIRWRDGVR